MCLFPYMRWQLGVVVLLALYFLANPECDRILGYSSRWSAGVRVRGERRRRRAARRGPREVDEVGRARNLELQRWSYVLGILTGATGKRRKTTYRGPKVELGPLCSKQPGGGGVCRSRIYGSIGTTTDNTQESLYLCTLPPRCGQSGVC